MSGVALSAFSSGKDDLGIYICFTVDADVYTKTTVFKTAYWFTDSYYLFVSKVNGTNLLQIEIRPQSAEISLETLKAVSGDFYNHLLDQEIRQQVIQETAAVRDTLIQKAFFEAKAALPPKMMSAEAHLPTSTQSYAEDPVHIEGK